MKKWITMIALVAMIMASESMGIMFWAGFVTVLIISFSITDEERRA
jgi:hypothetical protein